MRRRIGYDESGLGVRDQSGCPAGDRVVPPRAHEGAVDAASARPRRRRSSDQEHPARRGNRACRAGDLPLEERDEPDGDADPLRLLEVGGVVAALGLATLGGHVEHVEAQLGRGREVLERLDHPRLDLRPEPFGLARRSRARGRAARGRGARRARAARAPPRSRPAGPTGRSTSRASSPRARSRARRAAAAPTSPSPTLGAQTEANVGPCTMHTRPSSYRVTSPSAGISEKRSGLSASSRSSSGSATRARRATRRTRRRPRAPRRAPRAPRRARRG